jgi:transcriptional regulator with XRE-family HTH domain
MPRKRTLKLPPLDFGNETLGPRLARLRKERGLTQVELAERIGILQSMVSSYETNKLGLTAEMAIRFALALEVSTDEILHPKRRVPQHRELDRRVMRRVEQINRLPAKRQSFVLRALDSLLKGEAIA